MFAQSVRAAAVLTCWPRTARTQASNGEAKRKLAEGAVKLEGAVVNDPGFVIAPGEGEALKLSLGKKKHGLVTR